MFSRKFFCAFVCFVSVWILGCADASQIQPEPELAEGAAGHGPTSSGTGNYGSGDNQCAGSHCSQSTPSCFENGEEYVCCKGYMLPADFDGQCDEGAGGYGQGGSGQGNSGNQGQGNYPNDGGANGQGGQGAQAQGGSSPSDGGSSSTGTGGSSSGSGGGTVGELTITVVPPAFGTHNIVIKGDEVPYRNGGVSWGNPAFTESSGTRKTFSIAIVPGSKFTFSPVYDPPVSSESDPAYWKNVCCDTASMTRNCAMWASWDNDPLDGRRRFQPQCVQRVAEGLQRQCERRPGILPWSGGVTGRHERSGLQWVYGPGASDHSHVRHERGDQPHAPRLHERRFVRHDLEERRHLRDRGYRDALRNSGVLHLLARLVGCDMFQRHVLRQRILVRVVPRRNGRCVVLQRQHQRPAHRDPAKGRGARHMPPFHRPGTAHAVEQCHKKFPRASSKGEATSFAG
ncbi:MAG: hypothetical protein ABIB04_04675 [Patescibacteria group bacterium]